LVITRVEGLALRLPDLDTATNDPTQDVLVVRVETDDGLVGLGECNHSAAAAQAFLAADGTSSIGAGVARLLLGRDPLEREQLVAELYEANYFSARRGIGLAVLHAIDVCLWDLVAQAQGEPLWRTLWGEAARPPQPYVTVYTGPGDYAESVDRMRRLLEASTSLGYRAVKLEPLPECVPEELISEFVAEGRRRVGDEVELLVDVGHRFGRADAALRSLETFLESRPAVLETPLFVDDLAEYARLVERSPVPIAASELYESFWEFAVLLDVGRVHVVQPWPNRMGITDTLRTIEEAAARGARTILAGWNTTSIGVAAGIHVAAGLPGGTALEHAPSQAYGFPLRSVAGPEPVPREGVFSLTDAPGLGVTLDDELVDRFLVDRRDLSSSLRA
jgi:L-rhamnonate dehydratase